MDVTPANPVRSERKQPQWDVYGSSSLPLSPDIYAPIYLSPKYLSLKYLCFVKNDAVILLGIRLLRGNMYPQQRNLGTEQEVMSVT